MPIPLFIQHQQEFESVAEQLSHVPAFAIDTEFDNNHYAYGFTLCLIQIATSDACFLIDPFDVKDLSPLWRILENPAIEKVMHDSGEDMRLFYLHGCAPRNIYDTSVATKLLSFEKIGLGSVLSEVLGVEFSKKKQQSNWLKRPLIPLQLDYAANDVIHLLALRDALTERLKQQNRWEWFKQSMPFLEQKNYAPKSRTTFLSTKEQRDFSPSDQYILNELYRFRDEQARLIAKPVYQVFSEQIIYDILQQPAVLENWMQLKGIHYRVQNEAIGQQLKETARKATIAAQELGLSQQKTRPTPQQLAEMQRRATRHNSLRDGVFLPMKRWIEQKYGTLFVPYVLSNETISNLISGDSKLGDVGPAFQQAIIKEAAEALEIDISEFC